MTEPKTLLEAVRTYSDLDTCHVYMLRLKWPDGKITCPAWRHSENRVVHAASDPPNDP